MSNLVFLVDAMRKGAISPNSFINYAPDYGGAITHVDRFGKMYKIIVPEFDLTWHPHIIYSNNQVELYIVSARQTKFEVELYGASGRTNIYEYLNRVGNLFSKVESNCQGMVLNYKLWKGLPNEIIRTDGDYLLRDICGGMEITSKKYMIGFHQLVVYKYTGISGERLFRTDGKSWKVKKAIRPIVRIPSNTMIDFSSGNGFTPETAFELKFENQPKQPHEAFAYSGC